MIKSQNEPSTPPRPPYPSFVESESPLGISFELRDDRKRFVPHSFLSAVDFTGAEEMIFRYTFCTITVRGKALASIWSSLCAGKLGRIIERPSQGQVDDEVTVASVSIEDETDTSKVPMFPMNEKGRRTP